MMKKIFGKNWRTTLLGYGAALVLAVGDLISTGGSITGATLAKAAFAAIVGRVAKDAGVTGEEV
jgi:hypothetical protein